MAEILSQQEIDSLLSGFSSGKEQDSTLDVLDKKFDKDVVTFDFRLPHRLSKNQLRTLQAVHESFGESLASYLLSRLQTTVSINVSAVDQLFYSEYVLSISSPSCLYVMRVEETEALALFEFSPQLVLAMVERLLGGAAGGDRKPRLITKLEQSIVKAIVQRTISELKKAWEAIAPLTFTLDRYETEGEFAQIAPASEIVLVISFEVTIGEQKFLMSLCFPTFAFEEVLAKLNVQSFSGVPSGKNGNEWSKVIRTKLEQTSVLVDGLLGCTSITLADLLDLEEGDIIRTGIPMTAEMEVRIGNRTRFWGTPGISNGKSAIKITRVESGKD